MLKRFELFTIVIKINNFLIRALLFVYSPNIFWMIKSKRMKWVVHVACKRGKGKACRILVGKAEGERLLGRTLRK